ncbi:unnamed protein product [Lampetra fluviatilis]
MLWEPSGADGRRRGSSSSGDASGGVRAARDTGTSDPASSPAALALPTPGPDPFQTRPRCASPRIPAVRRGPWVRGAALRLRRAPQPGADLGLAGPPRLS